MPSKSATELYRGYRMRRHGDGWAIERAIPAFPLCGIIPWERWSYRWTSIDSVRFPATLTPRGALREGYLWMDARALLDVRGRAQVMLPSAVVADLPPSLDKGTPAVEDFA